jgi:hypothetical protein
MRAIALTVVLVAVASGCQTPHLDPNYAAQIQAYQDRERMWAQVQIERARTEQARYLAIQHIANDGDPQSRQTALMVLALSGGGAAISGAGASGVGDFRSVPLPVVPETQEDKALKWTQVLLGPTIGLVAGYYGYKMGIQQSNNAAATSIAGYDTIRGLGIAGYTSLEGTARTGFMANASIANQGLGFGRDLLGQLERPNIIITDGVLGSGSYVGPNSGTNSGNTGRITSPDCPNSAGNGFGGVLTPQGIVVPGVGGSASINCGATSTTGRP